MKQARQTFSMFLLLAAAVLVFSACSGGDAPDSQAELIGTWQSVSFLEWEKNEGKLVWGSEEEMPDSVWRVFLYDDGTYQNYEYTDGEWTPNKYIGTWRYKDGKLYLSILDEYGEESREVKLLDASTLEMLSSGTSYDRQYYFKATYRKVSD